MPRFNFWRKERDNPADPTSARSGSTSTTIPIRDAERRRLARLLVRKSNIEYDLTQAETAFMSQNRWTERIAQLEEAIDQANEDIEHLAPQPGDTPHVELPPTPIRVDVRSVDVPSEIAIQVGETMLLFREELDWAERGHQVALPKLTQVDGDVEALVPTGMGSELSQLLSTHLRNSFSVIANESLERTADGEPLLDMTLDDLVRPCEECGGWLDPLGRCPACTELDWKRNEIAAATTRLIDERNDVMADLERTRERLPVFRRQLQDVERDIAELRAKGVEPE
jgi:hypothetical protein